MKKGRSNSEGIDRFLKYSKGVIHVGGSIGQERRQYYELGLPVIWVEPIPEIFEQLKENIKYYKNQVAFKALITDKDNKYYKFYITNNRGESSSIYDFKLVNEVWSHIEIFKTMRLKSITLKTLLKREKINLKKYDSLVLDTQGSELDVLKGADLTYIKYIKIEVPNFEAYKGGCQVEEVSWFMKKNGYKKVAWKDQIKYLRERKVLGSLNGKNYYDFVYKKRGV